MCNCNSINKAVIISQSIVLFGTILVAPAVAQGFNFVDLNQSRQFFEQGSRKIERELGVLESNQKTPEIKLPQDYQTIKNIEKFDSFNQHQRIQPISDSVINYWDKSLPINQ